MAAIFCIIDGMTDEQWSEIQNEMRCWKQAGQQGAVGFLQTTPPGQSADSVGCILRLLGHTGTQTGACRGWIEALGCDIPFAADDLLLRASWVTLDEQCCSTGLAEFPLEAPAVEQGICYYSLGGYKAMLVLQHGASWLPQLRTCTPHQHFGASADVLLPKGIEALTAYIKKYCTAEQILIPWGQACAGSIPAFSRQAVLLAGCSTALGIGRALHIPVQRPPGATGDVDTDLSAKAAAALQAAERYPLVILHINGADEAGHRKNRAEKRAFLQQVDAVVFAQLLQSNHALLFTADHGCSPKTGSHLSNLQPFVLAGTEQKGNLGVLSAAMGLQLLCGKM